MSNPRYTRKSVELMVARAVGAGLMPADTAVDTAYNGSKAGRYYYVVQVGERGVQRNRTYIGQGATRAAETVYAMMRNADDLLDEKGV